MGGDLLQHEPLLVGVVVRAAAGLRALHQQETRPVQARAPPCHMSDSHASESHTRESHMRQAHETATRERERERDRDSRAEPHETAT